MHKRDAIQLTDDERRASMAAAKTIIQVMRAQARKRVVIKVAPERVVSWDHRRLGGAY